MRRRKLSITSAGRWYVALTIVMGAVVTASGNNVLYLMESFLLGGLILSGVLSERAVSALEVKWRRRPAVAGKRSRDRITVLNRRRAPVFCIEVGEWVDGRFRLAAFIPYISGRESVTVAVGGVHPARGRHRWDGLAVATKYPFGFASKTRIIEEPGERLIWPSPDEGGTARLGDVNREGGFRFSDGEVRPMLPEDDFRYVVWSASALRAEPLVRKRRSDDVPELPELDLAVSSAEEFEKRLNRAATQLYRRRHPDQAPEPAEEGGIVLLSRGRRRKIFGTRRALNVLAVIQPEQPESRE